jgi:hypothetical protein
MTTIGRPTRLTLTSILLLAAAVWTPLRAQVPREGYMTASDGVRLHYFELGQSGTPVVLIHGYTASWPSTLAATAGATSPTTP